MNLNKKIWIEGCTNCRRKSGVRISSSWDSFDHPFLLSKCSCGSPKMEVVPVYKGLLRRIGEVLFYKWDPIGVSSEPKARDEYETYELFVYSSLFDENAEESVFSYLEEIELDSIRLTTAEEKKRSVVKLLIKYRDYHLKLMEKSLKQ